MLLNSLKYRFYFVANICLFICLLSMGFIIKEHYWHKQKEHINDKLHKLVYNLVERLNNEEELIILPQGFYDHRLFQSNSGLYAVIKRNQRTIWSSPSVKENNRIKFHSLLDNQEEWQGEFTNNKGQKFISVSYRIKKITPNNNDTHSYIVSILESEKSINKEFYIFMYQLTGGLFFIAILMLFVNWFGIKWYLMPLNTLSIELTNLEKGKQSSITRTYPVELLQIIGDLNSLLQNEKLRQERYKNSLSDLVHSIKTPLTIVKATINENAAPNLCLEVNEQINIIDQTVYYYLRRARNFGKKNMLSYQKIDVDMVINKAITNIKKLYLIKNKNVDVIYRNNHQAIFYGIKGDLIEIIGNLLDNACKWAHAIVKITVISDEKKINIVIVDDGPGISEKDINTIIQRGTKANNSKEGHGIGLATVDDIVSSYFGSLEINNCPKYGGAKISINFYNEA